MSSGRPTADDRRLRRPRPPRRPAAHRPAHVRARRGGRAQPERHLSPRRPARARRPRRPRARRGRRAQRQGPADRSGKTLFRRVRKTHLADVREHFVDRFDERELEALRDMLGRLLGSGGDTCPTSATAGRVGPARRALLAADVEELDRARVGEARLRAALDREHFDPSARSRRGRVAGRPCRAGPASGGRPAVDLHLLDRRPSGPSSSPPKAISLPLGGDGGVAAARGPQLAAGCSSGVARVVALDGLRPPLTSPGRPPVTIIFPFRTAAADVVSAGRHRRPAAPAVGPTSRSPAR